MTDRKDELGADPEAELQEWMNELNAAGRDRAPLYCPSCANRCLDQGLRAVWCGACSAQRERESCLPSEEAATAAIRQRQEDLAALRERGFSHLSRSRQRRLRATYGPHDEDGISS